MHRPLRYGVLLVLLWLLLLAAGGCVGTGRHVSTTMSIPEPVQAVITADIQANDRGAVQPMAIEGPGCCKVGRVALIEIDGLLLNTNMTGPYSANENPVATLREKLDAAAADPQVAAVVLRIHSPGGGVAASEMMWQDLMSFRRRKNVPMVACLMDVATGGAYYLATASDVIVAYSGTITGGIGVILNTYNLQDTLNQYNVRPQPIKSGENIDMGSTLGPMSTDVRQWLQAMADEHHQRFKELVLKQRPRVSAADATNFDGRIFTARQAIERGLVDRVGTIEDAIAIAGQASGSQPGAVVMYRRAADPARSPYAITSNSPALASMFPVSLPGIERARLPSFLYLWEPDPTIEKVRGNF